MLNYYLMLFCIEFICTFTTMKHITQPELSAIIRYELETSNIDKRKCLEFIVAESKLEFTVFLKWYDGIITDSENDPTIEREPEYIESDDYFRILKTESLSKLKGYIEDFINGSIQLEYTEDKF
jgi:hypothetical protein